MLKKYLIGKYKKGRMVYISGGGISIVYCDTKEEAEDIVKKLEKNQIHKPINFNDKIDKASDVFKRLANK